MPRIIRAVKPNPGIRAAYRRKLEALLDEMQRSVLWWLRAAYRKDESRIVQDASPAILFRGVMGRLFRRWMKKWGDKAEAIAREFIDKTQRRARMSHEQAFKAAGFTVKMQPSRVQNATVQALIAENVALIKSIPQRYLAEVEEMVMRSTVQGRDLNGLTEELHKRYEITRRRAAMIARDQSNKATAAINQVESQKLGIKVGIWVHVPGRKMSRKTHEAMNGKPFLLAEGLYDPEVNRKVKPGELPLCACVYRDFVPEFGDKMTPEIEELLKKAG